MRGPATWRSVFVLTALLCGVASSAAAQSGLVHVDSSSALRFGPSPDHDSVTYTVRAVPLQTLSGALPAPVMLNVGRPALTNGEVVVPRFALFTAIRSNTTYQFEVRAVNAQGTASEPAYSSPFYHRSCTPLLTLYGCGWAW